MKRNIVFMMFLAGIGGMMLFNSCSKNDGNDTPASVQSDTIRNIYAEKAYVKFSFAKRDTVPSNANDWDIAFNSTTIIVNGGTAATPFARTGQGGLYVAKGLMSDIVSVDNTLFKVDTDAALALTTGSDNGWYHYDMNQHIITPVAGVILVIRTYDGKYAKMEILSYYKDAPATVPPASMGFGYYTFDYVYQPNYGKTTFSNN